MTRGSQSIPCLTGKQLVNLAVRVAEVSTSLVVEQTAPKLEAELALRGRVVLCERRAVDLYMNGEMGVVNGRSMGGQSIECC